MVDETQELVVEDDPQIVLRRLGLGDLPAVEAVERRAYPTPW